MQKKNSSINPDALGNKNDAIRIRHGGVLGLCAFIHAHPYDVPKYVPSVFEHLGLHMNDPQPIPVIYSYIIIITSQSYITNSY